MPFNVDIWSHFSIHILVNSWPLYICTHAPFSHNKIHREFNQRRGNWMIERTIDYCLCWDKEQLPYSRPAVCGPNYLAGHPSRSNPVTDIKIAPSSQSGLLCGKKLAICGLGVCLDGIVMPERWPYHASFIYTKVPTITHIWYRSSYM